VFAVATAHAPHEIPGQHDDEYVFKPFRHGSRWAKARDPSFITPVTSFSLSRPWLKDKRLSGQLPALQFFENVLLGITLPRNAMFADIDLCGSADWKEG
jgi:hypothetical protein